MISATDLGGISELYDKGLYLQAYAAAERLGPFEQWAGTAARIMAGRLVRAPGGEMRGRRLLISAWRNERTSGEARYYRARRLIEERGPLPAWQFMRAQGDELHDTPARLECAWIEAQLAYRKSQRKPPAWAAGMNLAWCRSCRD